MMNTNTAAAVSYYCILLHTPNLTSACRIRLERIGFEYIGEGKPFEVYGVAEKRLNLLPKLLLDPDVAGAEEQEPPAGM